MRHIPSGGLTEVLSAAEANSASYLEVVEQLVELELQGRERKRLQANLRKAGFPVVKRLEEFDYRHQTTITKRQINQLLDFRFLDASIQALSIRQDLMQAAKGSPGEARLLRSEN